MNTIDTLAELATTSPDTALDKISEIRAERTLSASEELIDAYAFAHRYNLVVGDVLRQRALSPKHAAARLALRAWNKDNGLGYALAYLGSEPVILDGRRMTAHIEGIS